MNTQVEEKDEGLQQGSTPEERFFGVNHEVNLDDDDDDGKVEIETGEEESKPAPAAAADDDGGQKDELGEEMEEYSERVQKRINKLTWQAKEADRRAKRLESERDEAFRATQSLYSQNQQYQQVIHHGEAHLIQRMKSAAEAAVASAEAKYRKAYEDGDTDAIIAAQKELIGAQAEVGEANAAERDYNWRANQQRQMPQMPMPQPQPQQPQVNELEPEVMEWSEKNPWFNDPSHLDMTAVALSEHERLIRQEHIAPNTPAYYEKIDAKMREVFPKYFKGSDTSAPATVVAPADRSAPTGKPRKVKLTPSALKLAKRLGLTPEQYANQVLKDRGLL